ncbi:MAG: extracellular solute-binding protein [Candidatus Electrothrix sp. AUS1_2]|nr:extracellular solute-binding protein [Candidatus Electrothrix sp. AUS1_2]
MNMFSKYIIKSISIALFFLFTPPVHAEEMNIILWHKETASKEFISDLCAEFSKKHQVSVKAEYIPVNHFKQALIKSSLRGRLPDIALVPSDFVGLCSLINLSEIPASLNNPNIGENAYATVRVGGKIYGAPVLGGNHIMMYYNKEKVKTPATTWAELFAQKAELEQQGIKTIGWSYNDVYWFVGFMGAFGGWPMEGEKITLNTKAMQEALTFYKSLADKGLIPQDCNSGCSTERFFAGEFAYALNGDWAYLETEKALGKNFGVAVIPSIGTRPVTPMYSTHALIFPGKSLQGPKREILEQLIRTMQSEQVQRHWYTALKRLPVHEKVLAEFKQQADPNQQQLLKQLERARAMPGEPGMCYAWEGIRKGFYRFLAGSLDADQASALMQQVAEPQGR